MGLLPRVDKSARRIGIALVWSFVIAFSPGYGQPANHIIYSRQTVFRIPFETDSGERRLREVQLYVSEDRGQTWRNAATVPPEQRGFNFRAERDGLYWFTVRTVDFQGRANPTTVQGTRPQLEVVVDTQVPIVTLRPGAPRDGTYAVEWDIREDNLDLSSFLLEYRLPGSTEWIPLTVEPAATGQRSWNPAAGGALDVRLHVRDLAKNEGEATIKLTPGAQGYRPSGNTLEQDARGPANRTVPGKRWVNSKRISLNYEIKEKGPSGVKEVELWSTRDGRTWDKLSVDEKHEPPYVFEVHDEGIYGFTLIVRSGVGLSEQAPRNGDPPQVWVEVDLTKPVVHWVNVEVGRGSDSGWLTITWKATDKNLGREPIALSYADDPRGTWTSIASNLENSSGKYRWQMPAGIPYKFYVRVEATDLAGNVGALDTPSPVIVDLAQPKGYILGVEPAKATPAGRDQEPSKPGGH
jgi:hypothetical protein